MLPLDVSTSLFVPDNVFGKVTVDPGLSVSVASAPCTKTFSELLPSLRSHSPGGWEQRHFTFLFRALICTKWRLVSVDAA